MQTILVPVDFSEQSRNAAYHAAELARNFNGKILLFHAYMMPTPVSEVPYVMVTVDELQRDNEALIKREAAHFHERYGLEVEWLVRIGIPSDEIRAITEERKIDLVVMGMKGVGGLDKIIGSTTINTIRKLQVPVLVIPQDARYSPLNNIVYASDLDFENDVRNFMPLQELARKFNARLHIVHVRTNNNEIPDPAARESRFNEIFQGISYKFHEVEDSSVQHGINEYIQHHDCELLVMLAHKHSFFERLFTRNHTKAMVYETTVPLLVLHQRVG